MMNSLLTQEEFWSDLRFWLNFIVPYKILVQGNKISTSFSISQTFCEHQLPSDNSAAIGLMV